MSEGTISDGPVVLTSMPMSQNVWMQDDAGETDEQIARRHAAEDADQWTEDLARRALEPLLPEALARLRAVPVVAGATRPTVAAAAVIASLAASYSFGNTPDDITEAFSAGAGIDASVAAPIVELAAMMVRAGMLPEPRWWEPLSLAEHLAIAVARDAIAAGDDLAELLGKRLWLPAGLAQRVSEKAVHAAGLAYAADADVSDGVTTKVIAAARRPEARAAARDTVSAMTEGAGGRFDLAVAGLQLAQLRAVGGLEDTAADPELVTFIQREADRFAEACLGLSMLEIDLIRPMDPDERDLAQAASLATKFMVMTQDEGPHPLPDLIGGSRTLPGKLERLLAVSMQSYQQRAGPIVHWTIVFDEPLPDGLEDGDPVELGVGLLDEADGLEFVVRCSVGGESVDAPIGYSKSFAVHVLGATILALTKTVRIDVYARERNRSIRHVRQLQLTLKSPLLAKVHSRAAEMSRALLSNGEQEALELISRDLDVNDAEIASSGFGMLDSGKSEQLLEASLPATALGPFRTVTPEQEPELAVARRGALAADADRIEVGDETACIAAAEAAAHYRKVVERTRATARFSRDYAAELERITVGVASGTQAVVHLALGAHGLEALWADRANGELALQRLDLGEVNIEELRRAASEPLAGSLTLLDGPTTAGSALGGRLAEAADRRGLERLILCPTRFLHELPLHALPVGDSGRRLTDELAVIYAPSAAVIAMLQVTPARKGGTLIAAVDLPHAPDEAIAIGALTDNPRVLVAEAATPEAFLDGLRCARNVHVCCHGRYFANDYLASRLELAATSTHSGHLTVARLLAEADVAGLDLVVLGACLSGAGRTASSALDVAGGIDSALLGAGARNVASALWEIDDFAALLFHAQLYMVLSDGATLIAAHRAAVDLLRNGAWRDIRDLPTGQFLGSLGIDLDDAFDQIANVEADDPGTTIDFANLEHWSAYRLCGVGQLHEPP
ncbi:MAG: CHAT domain-containing protein [Solirubrobacteraceae bacterium]